MQKADVSKRLLSVLTPLTGYDLFSIQLNFIAFILKIKSEALNKAPNVIAALKCDICRTLDCYSDCRAIWKSVLCQK